MVLGIYPIWCLMANTSKFRSAKIWFLSTLLLIVVSSTINNKVLAQSVIASNAVGGDIVDGFISGDRKNLKVGFRIQSAPIISENPNSNSTPKSYIGFCDTFADQLLKDLRSSVKQSLLSNPNPITGSEIDSRVNAITLEKVPIVNFSDGKRFQAVVEGTVDVECGANSIRYDLPEVKFSDPFFKTGISILAKKDDIEKISLDEKGLGNLSIGVVSGTTTYLWLDREKGYRKSSIFQSKPLAIAALKIGDSVQGFASDYIVLKYILDHEPKLRESYFIYPNYLKEQDYGLVIRNKQNQLQDIVNKKTLTSASVLEEIKLLNRDYSVHAGFIETIKIKGAQLVSALGIQPYLGQFPAFLFSFLGGAVITLAAVLFSIKSSRKLALTFIGELWKKFLPSIVQHLYNLLQIVFGPKK
jgi:ABC-type amino acid transport substrate-binding protein